MYQVKRLVRGWTARRHRGVGYLGYLLTDCFVPQVSYCILYKLPRRLLRLGELGIAVLVLVVLSLLLDLLTAVLILLLLSSLVLLVWVGARELEISHVHQQAQSLTEMAQSTHTHDTFTSWAQLPVEARTRKAVETARKANPAEEIIIGCIDKDGRVLGLFGELPGLESVSEADFVERDRCRLEIVLVKDNVLARKDFRGDRVRFVREWCSLATLYGKANVPAIYKVDEDRSWLYMSLILGRTVRLILADAGAKILTVETKDDPELAGLDPASRIETILARGTALIPSCVSEDSLREIKHQIDTIHACGVASLSLAFGDIIVDSQRGIPWFIDFEDARVYRFKSSTAFTLRRDQDRVKFNRVYGRRLITERSARAALAAELPWKYAPVDFGNGLTVGAFWSVGTGTGRWEFLNKHVMPPLTGKRVLDLGSNNGVMPMMMLRAGASEVIGLEISPSHVEKAQLVHSIYEWRDMRRYALQIHNCDMLEILWTDWGKFDLVTAFCSLYYLEIDDMARVVRKASELAPIMVLQANIGGSKRKKASVTFLKKLLEENGFPQVDIFAPPDYSRPLLIGRAAAI